MAATVDSSHLPIRQFTKDIVKAVEGNDVVVIIGETGSGKTTQLSQILLEAGYAKEGLIGVTQPRRVGAVTVARRVAEERAVELGGEVGYAVRFEDRTSSSTRIKYLTDGTLLRECLEDAQLGRYQVLILDEAHERSLNTDILFGILKKLSAVLRRGNLKLIITSATLDGEKFSEYFGGCPVFNVPGRCYPVDIIHAKEDHLNDYASAAVDTVMQIHEHEPAGDILVFLTGQAEIEKAVRAINEAVCALPEGAAGPMLVLPLHASLPPELQMRVFRPGPEGARRCIVATNVAETSVTVEGIVYVVDSGVVKQKHHHADTGMDSLDVGPISRVQATQRAGRAGRMCPGKCYRLYTRTYYERKMPDATEPEIQRTSLAGAVLHLKSLDLDIDVLSFEFLDAPAPAALSEALRQLYVLDAIDADGQLTQLGKRMAVMPLEPSLARALFAAQEYGCLDEMVTVAAMLSSERVFSAGHGPDVGNGLASEGAGPSGRGGPDDEARRRMRALVAECNGDHLLLLRLYQLWVADGCSKGFCQRYGLDVRGMNFARDCRRQLEGIVGPDGRGLEHCHLAERRDRSHAETGPSNNGSHKRRRSENGGMAAPSSKGNGARHDALRRALTVGFANRIARRMRLHNGYKTMAEHGQLAQLHPSSANLATDDDGLLPEWVIYHEFVATSRPFLRQVCPTCFEWVAPLLPKLREVDVQRLSGGAKARAAAAAAVTATLSGAAPQQEVGVEDGTAAKLARRNDDSAVDAARLRYLQRRQQQGAVARR